MLLFVALSSCHRRSETKSVDDADPAVRRVADASASGVGASTVGLADASPSTELIDADDAPLACIPVDGAARALVVTLKAIREPSDPAMPCQSNLLVLAIPGFGVRQTLCRAGCGPFEFDSRAGEGRATYTCRSDLQNEVGELRATTTGLMLTVEEPKDDPSSPLGSLAQPAAPSHRPPPRRSHVPLPCGARVTFAVTGKVAWHPN